MLWTTQCEQVVSELALAEEMEREILVARREAVREVRACKRPLPIRSLPACERLETPVRLVVGSRC